MHISLLCPLIIYAHSRAPSCVLVLDLLSFVPRPGGEEKCSVLLRGLGARGMDGPPEALPAGARPPLAPRRKEIGSAHSWQIFDSSLQPNEGSQRPSPGHAPTQKHGKAIAYSNVTLQKRNVSRVRSVKFPIQAKTAFVEEVTVILMHFFFQDLLGKGLLPLLAWNRFLNI